MSFIRRLNVMHRHLQCRLSDIAAGY